MPKSQSYQWSEEAPVHVSRRPPNPGGAVVQDWKAYGYGGFEKSGPGIHCKAPATKRRYAPGRKARKHSAAFAGSPFYDPLAVPRKLTYPRKRIPLATPKGSRRSPHKQSESTP